MINFRKDKSGLSIINIIGCCMLLVADDSKSSGTIMPGCCKPPTPCGYGYANVTFWTGTLSYADSDRKME